MSKREVIRNRWKRSILVVRAAGRFKNSGATHRVNEEEVQDPPPPLPVPGIGASQVLPDIA